MNKVIRVDEIVNGGKTLNNPLKYTHLFGAMEGWYEVDHIPDETAKVVYLGRCSVDGDMFAEYDQGFIRIYKGHLNSGEY